ncbi:hypothetical protein VNO77_02322 [Canavalia gladiata]|uniref:Uncharacterized protein n=1 Tax=Canavalia gladiata TaxID=3824 RepID=A0AAN9R606_CANGL
MLPNIGMDECSRSSLPIRLTSGLLRSITYAVNSNLPTRIRLQACLVTDTTIIVVGFDSANVIEGVIVKGPIFMVLVKQIKAEVTTPNEISVSSNRFHILQVLNDRMAILPSNSESDWCKSLWPRILTRPETSLCDGQRYDGKCTNRIFSGSYPLSSCAPIVKASIDITFPIRMCSERVEHLNQGRALLI